MEEVEVKIKEVEEQVLHLGLISKINQEDLKQEEDEVKLYYNRKTYNKKKIIELNL